MVEHCQQWRGAAEPDGIGSITLRAHAALRHRTLQRQLIRRGYVRRQLARRQLARRRLAQRQIPRLQLALRRYNAAKSTTHGLPRVRSWEIRRKTHSSRINDLQHAAHYVNSAPDSLPLVRCSIMLSSIDATELNIELGGSLGDILTKLTSMTCSRTCSAVFRSVSSLGRGFLGHILLCGNSLSVAHSLGGDSLGDITLVSASLVNSTHDLDLLVDGLCGSNSLFGSTPVHSTPHARAPTSAAASPSAAQFDGDAAEPKDVAEMVQFLSGFLVDTSPIGSSLVGNAPVGGSLDDKSFRVS